MTKKLVLSLFLLFLSPLLLVSPVKAEDGEKAYVLGKDEVVDEDLIVGASKVRIYGTVNGDLYAAGGTVLIDGTVNGDILVIGGTVEFSGTVTKNARILGGDVLVSGEVGNNLSICAGNVEISDKAVVYNSLVVGAGTVIIDGEISGKSNIAGGVVTVSGMLSGDTKLGTGALELTSGAEAGGNLDYWSENEANISDEATVSGQVNKHDPVFNPENMISNAGKEKISGVAKTFTFTAKVIWLVSAFVVGMIFVSLFPKLTSGAVQALTENSLKTAGYGLASLFAIPIFFFFLLLTMIGAPLGFIILALYFIYIYLAKIIVSLMVGRYITKRADFKVKDGWSLFLGLAVYSALSLLPVFGGTIKFMVIIAGLGGLVIATKQLLPSFAKKK